LAALGALAYALWGSKTERGTRDLVEAFSRRRPIEGRLSGGFKAAIFNPSRDDTTDINAPSLDKARELLGDAAASGKPDGRLAYAKLLLLDGKTDDSYRQFVELARTEASGAQAHNDLGVCLMQRGQLEDALDEFNSALTYDSRMNEALYNRALCYEKLQLIDTAIAAFDESATIERDNGWLAEIRQRTDRLKTPNQPSIPDVSGLLDVAFREGRFDEARDAILRAAEPVRTHALVDLVKNYRTPTRFAHLRTNLDGEITRSLRAWRAFAQQFHSIQTDSIRKASIRCIKSCHSCSTTSGGASIK
jgi:tetratricopeptide (TPR) repeat protein